MRKINVKICFVTNPKVLEKPNALLWDNYEEKVRADIRRGLGGTYIVYLKHEMPRSEMDRIIIELCERIAWDGHLPIHFGSIDRRYTFSGGTICYDIVSEASYQFVL